MPRDDERRLLNRIVLAMRFDDDDGAELAHMIAQDIGPARARLEALAFERAAARAALVCLAAAEAFRSAAARL